MSAGFSSMTQSSLNRSSQFLEHNILKILDSKCMHNFPPHLSCVSTLPENTPGTYRHVFFLWVCSAENEAAI